MGASADAIPAPDTFRMVGGAEYVHIHLAYPAASAAGSTFVCVDVKTVEGDFIEQRIKGAQWTDPFAERAIKEHGKHHNAEQNAAFPCEQRAQTGADAPIGNRQRDASFQNTGRTDIFAEKRVAQTHLVYDRHGQDDHKDNQNDIFETGEEMQLFGTAFFVGIL